LPDSQTEVTERQLEQLGRDYICSTPLPNPTVSVRFMGQFLGGRVVWDMTLGTLASYQKSSRQPATPLCPFIEIQDGADGVYPITVGLDLLFIDEPAIKKTIIMVRNYKRLVIGKIEFCPPAPAP